jgi:hypothetical protein
MDSDVAQVVARFATAALALENGLGALTSQLEAQLGPHIQESAYSAAQALGAANALTIMPASSGWEMISCVYVTLPAGSTGVLQLGKILLPMSPGNPPITPVAILLGPNDPRVFTLAGAVGPVAVLLTGQISPTGGVAR